MFSSSSSVCVCVHCTNWLRTWGFPTALWSFRLWLLHHLFNWNPLSLWILHLFTKHLLSALQIWHQLAQLFKKNARFPIRDWTLNSSLADRRPGFLHPRLEKNHSLRLKSRIASLSSLIDGLPAPQGWRTGEFRVILCKDRLKHHLLFYFNPQVRILQSSLIAQIIPHLKNKTCYYPQSVFLHFYTIIQFSQSSVGWYRIVFSLCSGN